jgi:hypothetical protein
VVNNDSNFKRYRLETQYKKNAIRAAKRVSLYRGKADLILPNNISEITNVEVYIDGKFDHMTVAICKLG